MRAPKSKKADAADVTEHASRAKEPPALPGAGRPLDGGVRQTMETRFGHDFSGVRVHSGAPSGARALTQGQHIVFGHGEYAPTTERGQRLIAHELAHVLQQSRATGTRGDGPAPTSHLEHEADRAADAALSGRHAQVKATSAQPVQFKLKPEQVAVEMVGAKFKVIDPFTAGTVSLAVGDTVRIVTWDVDAAHSVKVAVLSGTAAGQQLVVPQRILRPDRAAVAGVAPYSAGVAKQAAAVEKSEQALAAWQAKKALYTTPKATKLFAAEEARLEKTLTGKRDALNRKEIQEEMFNRFDAVIAREVAAANAAHGLTGEAALDPDLVKSQLFQESQMGTAGEHMSVPATHPVKTRFNLGQVIDSSALALLTLMEAEHKPLIGKFNLTNIRADLAAAQVEKANLKKKKKPTPAETARLATLQRLSRQNWEPFIWGYVAPGQAHGFSAAVAELFVSGKPVQRNLDYVFWIHLAVFWLFEKKKKGMSWGEAVRAYNGSGARARHYRAAVERRATAAESAAKANKEFNPL